MKLIQPIYLDTRALAGYAASIEGGLRTSRTETEGRDTTGEGGLNYGITAKTGVTKSSVSATQFDDHDLSRLHRLLDKARADPDDLDWVEVLQPDVDLSGIGTGAMVQWECEVFVPEMVANLQKVGGMGDAIDSLGGLMAAAETMNLPDDEDDLPEAAELAAMRTIIDKMDVPLTVVGEDLEGDSNWKILATLDPIYLTELSALEGPARCVGKVRKIVRPGRWYPLITVPGTGREERRRQERTPPTPDDQENFVGGPAVLLDMLAVYR